MGVTLDSVMLFDEDKLEFEVGSLSRASVERAVPGVDGVISIDLGQHRRKVKQTGVLRARSCAEMKEKTERILAYMDGKTHELAASSGMKMSDLRMDSFKILQKRTSGEGLCWSYEIVYTQLRV